MKKKLFRFLIIDTPILVLLIISITFVTAFILSNYVFDIQGGWL